MPKRLENLPLYPILLVASFMLAAFLDADVSPYAAMRAFAVVLTGAILLTVVAVVLLGQIWGGLTALAIVLAARAGSPTHIVAAVVLVIVAAIAWRYSRRLWPQDRRLQKPTGTLNLLASLLLVVTFFGAVVDGSIGRLDLRIPASPESLAARSEADASEQPDIYVILLDGYPRADTLARLFAFDNAPFLDALRERGFEVASGSNSNYMYTELTLASMNHMEYVDRIANRSDVKIPYGVSLRSTINRNPLWEDLRSRGYVIATAKSHWENVAYRSADVFCGDAPNDFELFLVRTTLAGRALVTFDPSFEADSHRAAVNEAFDCLDRMSEQTAEPKLVFIHVGSPHLPVVFAEDGSPASGELFGFTADDPAASRADFIDGYVEQLKYLNSRVLASLGGLIRRPDEPIVIVMSDHGSELNLDWGSALNSDLAERFSNFFAARTPDELSLFACDVTPIQVFPTLLNTYFGESRPIPASRFFTSTAQDKLSFTEISDPDHRTC